MSSYASSVKQLLNRGHTLFATVANRFTMGAPPKCVASASTMDWRTQQLSDKLGRLRVSTLTLFLLATDYGIRVMSDSSSSMCKVQRRGLISAKRENPYRIAATTTILPYKSLTT